MTSKLHAAANLARRIGMPGLPELLKDIIRKRPYVPPSGPTRHLSRESFAPVVRSCGSEQDKPASEVYQQWLSVPDGHKWLHYFEVYDSLLQPLRSRPIRMLEIGVYRGASLKTWRKYLHPESLIVGIDIDPMCARFESQAENVHVRIGSQEDASFLTRVVTEFGPFDVVLDDGSHVCSHMIASFNHLFLPGLVDHGIYIAEDTQTNFWPGYRDQGYSFVDLCKDLVDVMHCHYAIQPSELSYRLGAPGQTPSLTVPLISSQILEICFRDSMVVVRKKPIGALPTSQHL